MKWPTLCQNGDTITCFGPSFLLSLSATRESSDDEPRRAEKWTWRDVRERAHCTCLPVMLDLTAPVVRVDVVTIHHDLREHRHSDHTVPRSVRHSRSFVTLMSTWLNISVMNAVTMGCALRMHSVLFGYLPHKTRSPPGGRLWGFKGRGPCEPIGKAEQQKPREFRQAIPAEA